MMTISNIGLSLIGFVAAMFLAAYFYGWYSNAVMGAHYDLTNLRETAAWILGNLNITHLINSGLNTSIPWLQKDENDIKIHHDQ